MVRETRLMDDVGYINANRELIGQPTATNYNPHGKCNQTKRMDGMQATP
jgi:hypothetical protein